MSSALQSTSFSESQKKFANDFEEFSFEGPQRWRLHGKIWKAQTSPSQGTILGVPGYTEHSGLYLHVASFFVDQGYDVMFFDLPGHGRSEGARSNIDDFEDYILSLDAYVKEAMSRSLRRPYHLLAHSLGGLISIRFLQTSFFGEKIDSLTLSSPLLGLARYPRPALPYLSVLASILPNFTMANPGDLGENVLTHDKEIEARRKADPLVKSQVTIHWVREITKACRAAFKAAHHLRIPVGFFLSGKEFVTNLPDSQAFYQLVNSRKFLKIYPEMYHEILNEIGREGVMQEMIAWIHEIEKAD